MSRLLSNLNCCYSFPYGWYTILPLFLCLAGTALTATAAFSCHLFTVDFGGQLEEVSFGLFSVSDVTCIDPFPENLPEDFTVNPDNLPEDGNPDNLPEYCYSTSTTCVPYSDHSLLEGRIDTVLQLARAFALIALVFGLGLLIFISMLCCVRTCTCGIVFLCVATAITGFVNLLMLVGLGSTWCIEEVSGTGNDFPVYQIRDGCEVDYSFILCIVSSFVWFLASCSMCCMNPRVRRLPDATDGDKDEDTEDKEANDEEVQENEEAEKKGDESDLPLASSETAAADSVTPMQKSVSS